MNELRRFKHSADFLANSSHIIESAAINPTNPLALRKYHIKNSNCFKFKIATSFKISAKKGLRAENFALTDLLK